MTGDDDARERFEALAAEVVEPVRRFLARRTDRDTADEVLAETLLVCWRRLDQVPDNALPWVYGVARNCLANVQRGDRRQVRLAARITVNAYPGQVFDGKVAFVYPTLTAETRTARVRIELANRDGRLKPAMYASVELLAGGIKGLTVPDSAVLDSGTRRIVLVQRGEGQFEPRPVKLGARADGRA